MQNALDGLGMGWALIGAVEWSPLITFGDILVSLGPHNAMSGAKCDASRCPRGLRQGHCKYVSMYIHLDTCIGKNREGGIHSAAMSAVMTRKVVA